MAKKKNKKQNKVIKKVNRSISEIENSRTGGQVSLIGYEYQVLYSSYLLLSFLINEDRKVRL